MSNEQVRDAKPYISLYGESKANTAITYDVGHSSARRRLSQHEEEKYTNTNVLDAWDPR